MKIINKLRAWSERHDTAAHIIMGFALTLLFGPWLAGAFMLGIEADQINVFGLRDRVKDTLDDLVADGIGLLIAMMILKFVFNG
jgi:membrane glycosyltransferase